MLASATALRLGIPTRETFARSMQSHWIDVHGCACIFTCLELFLSTCVMNGVDTALTPERKAVDIVFVPAYSVVAD